MASLGMDFAPWDTVQSFPLPYLRIFHITSAPPSTQISLGVYYDLTMEIIQPSNSSPNYTDYPDLLRVLVDDFITGVEQCCEEYPSLTRDKAIHTAKEMLGSLPHFKRTRAMNRWNLFLHWKGEKGAFDSERRPKISKKGERGSKVEALLSQEYKNLLLSDSAEKKEFEEYCQKEADRKAKGPNTSLVDQTKTWKSLQKDLKRIVSEGTMINAHLYVLAVAPEGVSGGRCFHFGTKMGEEWGHLLFANKFSPHDFERFITRKEISQEIYAQLPQANPIELDPRDTCISGSSTARETCPQSTSTHTGSTITPVSTITHTGSTITPVSTITPALSRSTRTLRHRDNERKEVLQHLYLLMNNAARKPLRRMPNDPARFLAENDLQIELPEGLAVEDIFGRRSLQGKLIQRSTSDLDRILPLLRQNPCPIRFVRKPRPTSASTPPNTNMSS